MPKIRFPVEFREMMGESIPHPARTGRLEVIDQGGNIHRRMDADEQMDMIGFSTEFEKPAAPIGQNLRKRHP
jgi:hypothetical protein